MRLIDADKLLESMNERYDEKKDFVSDTLAEGFMQMDKLINEQDVFNLSEHDKQIRNGVISEMLKQVEFEEKWLSDAWKENGYNYSSRDVDITFSGIKQKLIQMKGEQNE